MRLALPNHVAATLIAAALAAPLPIAAQTLADVRACLVDQLTLPDANGATGIAAAVAVDDVVVLRTGVGTVAPGSTRAVAPSTRFRIASTTKMMTATAALSEVDRGRLALDQRVLDQLPGFTLPGPASWLERVTPRRLLSHQGGMRDYITIDGARDDSALRAFWTDPAATANVPLMVPPGTFYNYANPNFAIAGAVAEASAGVSYRQLMQQRVFAPLGMNRAVFLPSEVVRDDDYAFGVSAGVAYGPNDYDNAWARPAGWAWASADDLLQMARFIQRGNPRILSNASWGVLRGRNVNTFEVLDREWYGFGVFAYDYLVLDDRFHDRVERREHGGNLPGYTTAIVTLPAQRFSMAIVGNGDGLDFDRCVGVAIKATVKFRLPAPSAFPDPGVRPDQFNDYVGWYNENTASPVVGPMYIGRDSASGQLTISLPLLDANQVPYERSLPAVSRDNFLLTVQGFPFLLTGFRQVGAINPQVRYARTRLFVGERIGYIPNLPPPAKSAATRSAFAERLRRHLLEYEGPVLRRY
jgi:CubicO group peptidase (beta-lactamase class C family)